MDIDWSQVLNDAENSPRAVLLSFLEQLDETDVDCLVLVANKVDADGNDNWMYESSGSAVKISGLLHAASRHIDRVMMGED